MITNCEECAAEVEFDLIDQCIACGADGLCPAEEARPGWGRRRPPAPGSEGVRRD